MYDLHKVTGPGFRVDGRVGGSVIYEVFPSSPDESVVLPSVKCNYLLKGYLVLPSSSFTL